MTRDIDTVLCDLDGVVWLAHEAIPGSVDAIRSLRDSGRRVLFVTNNSAAVVADHERALAAIGIEAAGDVVSSSMAAAFLVQPGERCLVTGGAGITEALEARGADVVLNDGTTRWAPDDAFDAVVVGLHRDFDYARLRVAGKAVLEGARLIGTNGDTTYPTPTGLEPGGGSIVAAVASVGGVSATIAGKPERAMVDVIADKVGASFDPSRAAVVGDRPETDGLFAERIGARFVLVESGVTRPTDVVTEVAVAHRVADLAAFSSLLH